MIFFLSSIIIWVSSLPSKLWWPLWANESSVTDNSIAHKGHYNFNGKEETHIKIELKKKFNLDIKRLEIHKKINTLLSDEFKLGLHSLQIKII